MKKGHWKVYVCRYAERFECECDFVICQDCYNKNNNTRSRQHNTSNASKLHNMFNPLLNEQTGEVWCVGNQVEYHKLQYLKLSDSAQIWIPSWQNKKRTKLQKQKKTKNEENTFPPVNTAKVVSKIFKLTVSNRKIL